jgi:hypothetical protein
MRFAWLLLLFCVVPLNAQESLETAVQFIELSGSAAEADAELSSLLWFGDTLLLIAENPQLYAEDGSFGSFFALETSDILAYLDAEAPNALEPYTMPVYADGLINRLQEERASFDGFEAAAIAGDRIYLQIECFTGGNPPMKSFIISGAMSEEGIRLDVDSVIELPMQSNYSNLSYESLILSEDSLIAIYEANGVEANPDALAYTIALETGELSTIPMLNIPYRITDASEMDEEGNFWVINYFYPGEAFLDTENDLIFAEFGMGTSQRQYGGYVERLLEFHYGENGIELVDHNPIQLEMRDESYGRNWEGIARLGEMGLLLVTDKFPETLFAFIPFD